MTLMTDRRIVLARFHDGTAKANWGGRGTSLALAGLVAGLPGVRKLIPLNGTYITEDFGDFSRVDKVAARLRHLRIHGVRYASAPYAARPFEYVEDYVDRLMAQGQNSRLRRLIAIIDSGDELWMNGEGNFILGYSAELWRTLIIMGIARRLGKRTVLLNSILSEPATGRAEPAVLAGVRQALSHCDVVLYRDPVSLDRSREWFPEVSAEWLPDALFQWSRSIYRSGAYSAEAESLPLGVQELLGGGERLAVISGSSVLRSYTRTRAQHLEVLVEGLRDVGLTPIFVATSDEDAWWEGTADAVKMPFVGARVPLRSGMELLAGAEVFVSGRYHPSILAADVGTPFVTYGSNSHKTTSLYRVLGDEASAGMPTLDANPAESGLLQAAIVASERAASREASLSAARSAAERTARGMRAAGLSVEGS